MDCWSFSGCGGGGLSQGGGGGGESVSPALVVELKFRLRVHFFLINYIKLDECRTLKGRA